MDEGGRTDDLGIITSSPGQWQRAVDPSRLRPSRPDLIRTRLDAQRILLRSGIARSSPIQVSTDGVIIDGHHAVRSAAEEGRAVDVLVTPLPAKARAASILDLPVR